MASSLVTFDLKVRMENAEQDTLELIYKLKPEWDQKGIKIIKFTDGITNLLYGCHNGSKEDMVLVRIYGLCTELFIDRLGELSTMLLLGSNGCASKLYCKFQNGLAYAFIPGMVLDVNTVREKKYAKLVAQEMSRLHSIKPEVHPSLRGKFSYSEQPCVFAKMRNFVETGPDSFEDAAMQLRFEANIPSKPDFLKEIAMLESKLSCLGSPAVLCHNDLLLGNLVYKEDEDRVYFIDYEYADTNYAAFDIADHFCEFPGCDVDLDYDLYPGKEFQYWWLKCYLEAKHNGTIPTDKQVETLYVQVNKFALAAHYLWGLWALIQAKYSTIDFDFLNYASVRFNEYHRRKDEFLSLKLPTQ